jgi:hypothetical protein
MLDKATNGRCRRPPVSRRSSLSRRCHYDTPANNRARPRLLVAAFGFGCGTRGCHVVPYRTIAEFCWFLHHLIRGVADVVFEFCSAWFFAKLGDAGEHLEWVGDPTADAWIWQRAASGAFVRAASRNGRDPTAGCNLGVGGLYARVRRQHYRDLHRHDRQSGWRRARHQRRHCRLRDRC